MTSGNGPNTATSEGMRHPRLLVLLVALAGISRSPAIAEQRSSRTDDTLTTGVTVDPTCTVAVTPGEWSGGEAIDIACRNLPKSHPHPRVTDAPGAAGNSAATVVIHF
jgi:hypothetical protein